MFKFSATAPDDGCQLSWKFETRDVTDTWVTIFDTTSIDDTPPKTIKTYGLPFFSNGEFDWISTNTEIALNAIDQKESCAIGVANITWRNTLLEEISEREEARPDMRRL